MRSALTKQVSISEMLYMREQGMSNKEIAHRLDVSQQTISRLLPKIRTQSSRHLTQSDIDKMREMLIEGKSFKEVANTFGVSVKTVKSRVKLGKGKPDTHKSVMELHNCGLSPKEIAEKLKVSVPTVYYHLHKEGVHAMLKKNEPEHVPQYCDYRPSKEDYAEPTDPEVIDCKLFVCHSDHKQVIVMPDGLACFVECYRQMTKEQINDNIRDLMKLYHLMNGGK